jgi:hypothetical protein
MRTRVSRTQYGPKGDIAVCCVVGDFDWCASPMARSADGKTTREMPGARQQRDGERIKQWIDPADPADLADLCIDKRVCGADCKRCPRSGPMTAMGDDVEDQ